MIAKDIVDFLPAADTFIDLFAGGCAVTHAALLSGKYAHVVSNDIIGTSLLFDDLVNGKKELSYDWVSSDEFHQRKHDDLVTAICWSFGNNLRSYICCKEKEEEKRKAAYEWCIAEGKEHVYQRYKSYKQWLKEQGKTNTLYHLRYLKRLEGLKHADDIDADKLESTKSDYRSVEVKGKETIIYCDPPYRCSETYKKVAFDYDAFYDWCEKQTSPVYISEYEMPEDRFKCVWEREKQVALAPFANPYKKTEKIWRPICQLKREKNDAFGGNL